MVIDCEREYKMKNHFKTLSVVLAAFVVGTCVNNYALSEAISSFKVAVVDVQKVVASSSQVKALKEDQKKKRQELINFVQKAKSEVAAEADATKKKSLEDKYNKELNTRKAAIDNDYVQSSEQIDKTISSAISSTAKDKGYNLVLSKSVVLYGGEDISAEVSANVK